MSDSAQTDTNVVSIIADPDWLKSEGTPIVRATDQIYRRLRLAILKGEIPSRTRLVEVDLANKLNVSRTPVREAISRLVSDLLVVPLAHGGVEVVDTRHEYEDVFAIREALEGMAARLAAERITDDELQKLEEVNAKLMALSVDNYASRAQLNSSFHAIILHASRSRRLIQMVEGFREFFITEKALVRYTARDTKSVLKHHADIVEALKARDGKRAERLVRGHIAYSKRRLQKSHSRSSFP